jgi:hypothetical protein
MKNLKRLQAKKAKQTARYLKPPPEKLARLIDLANQVPPGLPMESIASSMDLQAVHSSYEDWENETYKVVLSSLAAFPKDVREPFESFAAQAGKMALIHDYHRIQQAREKLQIIVGFNQKIAAAKASGKSLRGFTFAIPFRAYVGFDEQERLQIAVDEFASAVEDVEATRIRECANCGRFYWAGRMDQKCCSRKCNGVHRVRRHRELRAKGQKTI